jgi:heme/copper-type cytochrome/quinol oxidase subunit 2
MVTTWLLTGLLILVVLGLLVALVYSMARLRADAGTKDTLANDTAGQKRFFTASLLNFLNLK